MTAWVIRYLNLPLGPLRVHGRERMSVREKYADFDDKLSIKTSVLDYKVSVQL